MARAIIHGAFPGRDKMIELALGLVIFLRERDKRWTNTSMVAKHFGLSRKQARRWMKAAEKKMGLQVRQDYSNDNQERICRWWRINGGN